MTVHGRFWDRKNVLVTGFEGFLGSNLTRILVSYGALVTGLDIKVNRKQTILSSDDYQKIRVIKGSVVNYRLLNKVIKKNNIQIVFHLAAEALVGRGYSSPLKAFKSNICGTWNILEECRLTGNLEAIVVASSDKAYGSHDKLPYRENYALKGNHPYDVSKSCADLLVNTYFNTYGLPVAVTRCGNIYGPGDFNFSRLIPDAMRCMVKGDILQIRSNGKFVRDYVYVEDIVNGYIKIAELFKKRNLAGESFNFSNEHPLTVMEMIKVMSNLSAKGLKYKVLNSAKYEIRKQYLSSLKARKILGWKPGYGVKEGLKRTYTWYSKYFIKE